MARRAPDPVTKALAACGVAGPVLFTLVVAALGASHPGYSHAAQPMSALGAEGAPDALAMNLLGFGLFGVLVVAFAAGTARSFEGPLARVAAALVALGGLALVGVGLLPCEPGCGEGPDQAYHSIAASTMGVLMGASLWVWGAALRATPGWERHGTLTWAAAALVLVLGALLASDAVPAWEGLVQRASVAPAMLWIAGTGLRLVRG